MFSYLIRAVLVFLLSVLPFQAYGAESGKPAPVIKKSAYELPANSDRFAFIKILISPAEEEAAIETSGPYKILDNQGKVVFQAARLASSRVRAKGEILQLGLQPFHTNPLTIHAIGNEIKVKGAWYRHAIEIWRESNGKLMIINDIPMEDYLKGVLPSEVNPKWPAESLRTQAVAARTYALFKMIENQNQRYDLSKDVLSQVYGGKNSEHKLSNQAVEDTQGQILTYENKIFPTYFHSTCGGRTTHNEYIWPVEPHPSLQGVECNFCWKSAHYRWNFEIFSAELQKKLTSRGLKVSGITNFSVYEKDGMGRAKSFLIESKSGKVVVHSNDLRLWVDPMKIKSTWIQSIIKTKKGFALKGRGWGHGVGMCQYGIKQLGEMGYTYDRILKYYYPGSQLSQYWLQQTKSIESRFQSFLSRLKERLDLE